jgi:hypothetical protein
VNVNINIKIELHQSGLNNLLENLLVKEKYLKKWKIQSMIIKKFYKNLNKMSQNLYKNKLDLLIKFLKNKWN